MVNIKLIGIKDFKTAYGFYLIPTIRYSIGPCFSAHWLFWGIELYIADSYDNIDDFMGSE